MIKKASDAQLKKGFQMHLKQTRGQIKRLDRAFKLLKEKPKGTKCPAIDGILDEAKEIAGEIDDKVVLNAALIAAAQAVEHYEITRYGTLTAWAKAIGHSGVAKLLARQPQRGKGDRQEAEHPGQDQGQQEGDRPQAEEADPRRAGSDDAGDRRDPGDLHLYPLGEESRRIARLERMRPE